MKNITDFLELENNEIVELAYLLKSFYEGKINYQNVKNKFN